MKRIGKVLLLLLLIGGLSGCVVKDMGQTVKATFKGDFFLSSQKYEQGLETFKKEVVLTPNNASSYYYLGRFWLTQKKPDHFEALKNFQTAVRLSPSNTTYRFWQGVAYGSVGKSRQERKSYLQVLSNQRDHLQALTYLAHNYLEAKEYSDAMTTYNKVLKIWPFSPSALFNRAFIMRILDRTPEERLAWLEYLDVYPSGPMARRAVNYLNGLGDLQYRNIVVGARTVTIERVIFEPFTEKLKSYNQPSLDLIGSVFSRLNNHELHIIVFQKNNIKLAEKRAKELKKFLLKKHRNLFPQSIKLSWFDVPEEIKILGVKVLEEDESINFFTKKM